MVAFEPMPKTFELLASNVYAANARNVTLLNAAASDSSRVSGMTAHRFEDTGLDDLYTAELVEGGGNVQVLCGCLDSLVLAHRVALVKIDAEGHELPALHGVVKLLERDHPILIVEDNDPAVPAFLTGFGYGCERAAGSPNRCIEYRADAGAFRSAP